MKECSEVICDPDDPRIKDLLGKYVWAHNSIKLLGRVDIPRKLVNVRYNTQYAFEMEDGLRFQFIKRCPITMADIDVLRTQIAVDAWEDFFNGFKNPDTQRFIRELVNKQRKYGFVNMPEQVRNDVLQNTLEMLRGLPEGRQMLESFEEIYKDGV